MQIEQIYVVYTAINPETAPFYHKDLYYERSDGSVLYMRGAPGRNGNLSTSAQIFHPLSAELETVRSWELGREVITSGTDLSRTAQLLLLELRRINDAGITYVNDDTNSNWAADKALLAAGLSLPSDDNLGEFWSPGSIELGQTDRMSNDYVGGTSHLNVGNSVTGEECFPSGTSVSMWPVDAVLGSDTIGTHDEKAVLSGIWQKPIEEILPGDLVVSFDAEGNLVPGRVDKLFRNTTQEFVRLSFDKPEARGGVTAEGREQEARKGAALTGKRDSHGDLVATPGHRFLTETGDFLEIGHMLRLGGGRVKLVDKARNKSKATLSVAHMFFITLLGFNTLNVAHAQVTNADVTSKRYNISCSTTMERPKIYTNINTPEEYKETTDQGKNLEFSVKSLIDKEVQFLSGSLIGFSSSRVITYNDNKDLFVLAAEWNCTLHTSKPPI